VKAGKIKNDAAVIAGYEAKFKADFDGTKALVDGLSNNKEAVKIADVVNKVEGEDLPTMENAVAQDMARIQNKWLKK
jgi:ribosomal protein S17E